MDGGSADHAWSGYLPPRGRQRLRNSRPVARGAGSYSALNPTCANQDAGTNSTDKRSTLRQPFGNSAPRRPRSPS